MIVKTKQGDLEGVRDGGVTVFKGVRYAAQMTSAKRWTLPQDPPTWSGVRKADSFGPACMQPVFESMEGAEPVGDMSEDCLFLNVWTPETVTKPTPTRPVMVWIHGGAFKIGEGKSLMYQGSELAKKGAVVVTFNYRLGFLGFFTHTALEAGASNSPINFGLYDQLQALKWVRANIAGFGGDPSNVTIFGESAGAASVLSLMTSPLAKVDGELLFHKAIAQSAYSVPERSREHARVVCERTARRAWGVSDHATLQELRGLDEEVFALKAYINANGETKLVESLAPTAVFGDPVLPEKVRDVFDAQRQHEVPLLIGSNSNEQSIALAFGMDPAAIYDGIEGETGGPLVILALKALYNGDSDLEEGALKDKRRFGGLIMRDALFTMQARSLATNNVKNGQPAYRYYFKYVTEAFRVDPRHKPAPGPSVRPYGVDHGDEIVYAFDTGHLAPPTKGELSEQDRKKATIVSDCWLSFAKTGAPGNAGTVAWLPHENNGNGQHDRILEINDTIKMDPEFMITRLNQYKANYAKIEASIEKILSIDPDPDGK